MLGDTISRKNGTNTSESVLIQLESDLLKKSAMISSLNLGQTNRPNRSDEISKTLARLAPSHDTLESTDRIFAKPTPTLSDQGNNIVISTANTKQRSRLPQDSRRRSRSSSDVSLTPHFSGFQFENQNDAEWLKCFEPNVSKCLRIACRILK